nr:hypothetical protein B0A51_15137 [Rachicladosporium sp. CCFEE 5018]
MSAVHDQSTDVTLHPLFGIIVSEQSYLLGIRDLVATKHAEILVSRVIPFHIPDELVFAIAEHVSEVANRREREKEDPPRVVEGRLNRYGVREMILSGGRSPAEREAIAEMRTYNVALVTTRISRPGSKMPEHWIHMSAARVRPGLINNVPPLHENDLSALGPLPQLQYGVTYTYQSVKVTSHGDQGAQRDLLTLQPDDLATDRMSLGLPGTVPAVIARLFQLHGLDEAMKVWDQESVEEFVKKLRLEATPSTGKPGARIKSQLR